MAKGRNFKTIPAPGIAVEIEAKQRLERKARSCLVRIGILQKLRGALSSLKDGKRVDLIAH